MAARHVGHVREAQAGQSYTVHGDAVNLAARLEALCKEHGTSLLLSASTAKALPEAKVIAVGDIAVRGGLAEP